MNEELMDGKDRLLEENKKLQQENKQLNDCLNLQIKKRYFTRKRKHTT